MLNDRCKFFMLEPGLQFAAATSLQRSMPATNLLTDELIL